MVIDDQGKLLSWIMVMDDQTKILVVTSWLRATNKKMFLVDNGYREPKKILSHRMVISNQKKFSQ